MSPRNPPAAIKPLTIRTADRHSPSSAPICRLMVARGLRWTARAVSKVYVADVFGGRPRELSGAGASLGGAFGSSDGRALLAGRRTATCFACQSTAAAASAVWRTPQQGLSIVPVAGRIACRVVRPLNRVRRPRPPPAAADEDARRHRGSELWTRSLSDGRESARRPRRQQHDVGRELVA